MVLLCCWISSIVDNFAFLKVFYCYNQGVFNNSAMKKILFLSLLFLPLSTINAQSVNWVDSGADVYTLGNASIGSTTISYPFSVYGTNSLFRIENPSGSNVLSNFLNLTGTIPSLTTGFNGAAMEFTMPSTNSSALVSGLRVRLLSGTGTHSATLNSIFVANTATTTSGSTGAWSGVSGSSGLLVLNSPAAMDGIVKGVYVNVSGSSRANVGVNVNSINSTNSPDLNIGVMGAAANADSNIGGFFYLNTALIEPSFEEDSALVADNGPLSADIITARDNGEVVFRIADEGEIYTKFENCASFGSDSQGKVICNASSTQAVQAETLATVMFSASAAMMFYFFVHTFKGLFRGRRKPTPGGV